ncbi:MAG: glycosyltransferase [Microbacterium sp.]
MTRPAPSFAHLSALTDERGLFEHARGNVPRREHGYCVDDVVRALVVVIREPHRSVLTDRLASTYVAFVADAVAPDGRIRNRMSTEGRWLDRPDVGDWWGRALWALGLTAAQAPAAEMRARATELFRRAAQQRSPHLRATAYAVIGAAEFAAAHPDDLVALALARDAAVPLTTRVDAEWPWPEPRLRYANAVLAEGLLAAGTCLGDRRLVDRGLEMLTFLLGVETRGGHLSVTGVGGRGPADLDAQFDQQPIEVAVIAEACARAFDLTGDPTWRDGVALAWAWFEGANDNGTRMFDPDTGAGYDGLTRDGRNDNRGAESTLAALTARQLALRLRVLGTVIT